MKKVSFEHFKKNEKEKKNQGDQIKYIRIVYRKCLICGKKMKIKLTRGGRYNTGHFFSKLKIPIEGTGKHVKIGEQKIGKTRYDVVKWTGKSRKVEYWECNSCYDSPEEGNPKPLLIR